MHDMVKLHLTLCFPYLLHSSISFFSSYLLQRLNKTREQTPSVFEPKMEEEEKKVGTSLTFRSHRADKQTPGLGKRKCDQAHWSQWRRVPFYRIYWFNGIPIQPHAPDEALGVLPLFTHLHFLSSMFLSDFLLRNTHPANFRPAHASRKNN